MFSTLLPFGSVTLNTNSGVCSSVVYSNSFSSMTKYILYEAVASYVVLFGTSVAVASVSSCIFPLPLPKLNTDAFIYNGFSISKNKLSTVPDNISNSLLASSPNWF